MIRKRLLFAAGALVMILATAGVLWAICPSSPVDYQRPIPDMDWGFGNYDVAGAPVGVYAHSVDYVFQEIAMHDCLYGDHTAHNCRHCHGNNMAPRHHASDRNICEACYPPGPPPQSGCLYCHPTWDGTGSPPKGEAYEYEGGVRRARNCMADECHPDDATWLAPPPSGHGWHHNTSMAEAQNCIACHDPRYIEEITPFRDFENNPPDPRIQGGATPTPYYCEKCHWSQPIDCDGADNIPGNADDNLHYLCDGDTDPTAPGHPSTYDHEDRWGVEYGFFEYPKPIRTNKQTHHMKQEGAVYPECYKCHALDDPVDPDPEVNPFDPEYIRYCEICHSPRSLHAVGLFGQGGTEAGHVTFHAGWVPAGYHTGTELGPSGDAQNCDDVLPTAYRTADEPGGAAIPQWDNEGFVVAGEFWGQVPNVTRVDFNPVVTGNSVYTPEEQCEGCHEGLTFFELDIPEFCTPFIDYVEPTHGSPGVWVTLRGSNFGEQQMTGFTVQLKEIPGGTWVDVPIHDWTDTLIVFELPIGFNYGINHRIRVVRSDGCGTSNTNMIFTPEDHPTLQSISPSIGECSDEITLSGSGGFGDQQEEMFDATFGVRRIIDFVSPAGEYTVAGKIKNKQWNDTEIKFTPAVQGFFFDNVDPVADPFLPGADPIRNFVQDKAGDPAPPGCGSPVPDCCNNYDYAIPPDLTDPACANCCCDEPTINRCDCVAFGDPYSVYVKAVYFKDDDASGDLNCGDTIMQIEISDPVYFTFDQTSNPYIYKLSPRKIELSCKTPKESNKVKIYGDMLGTGANGAEIHIGSKKQYNTDPVGKGKIFTLDSPKVILWSNTLIKLRMPYGPCKWEGKTKYVWIVNDPGGSPYVTNKIALKILDSDCPACP